ncbi:murein transglycosylase [Actinoplanes sp. NPDC051346]|uniref:lytic transglycosylase domain-containing protein n=1 Tax=Actinoplanes sp. NPDC051346 TaxID=3155048 RepID=UPI00344A2B37
MKPEVRQPSTAETAPNPPEDKADAKPASNKTDPKPSNAKIDPEPANTKTVPEPPDARTDAKPGNEKTSPKPTNTDADEKPAKDRSDAKGAGDQSQAKGAGGESKAKGAEGETQAKGSEGVTQAKGVEGELQAKGAGGEIQAKDAGSKADEKAADGKTQPDAPAKTTKTTDADGMPAPSATVAALASRSRAGRTSRALRKAHPARVARNTSDWARRPSGRLILPAIVAVLLLGAAGTAGAYLVPKALDAAPTPSATPAFGVDSGEPVAPLPNISLPTSLPGTGTAPTVGGGLPGTTPVGVPGNRPSDALAGWAQQAGTRVSIPVVAVQAYGYAELVVARTAPTCHLSWTTIAAIAKVESAHGSANGAVLGVDGSVSPPIFGLPLDGKGGRQLIRDSDQGVLDKDAQFDRAMGPLQFIPTTWNEVSAGNAVDADNNGVSDPNDIDDAALATAVYLCKGGRDLSKADAWWDAILSYNAVRPYAQKVFDAANEYGVRSRS